MTETTKTPTWFLIGCTGQIGSRLIEKAQGLAHLVVLSRKPEAYQKKWSNQGSIQWVKGDATTPGDWQAQAAQADAIVNLLGENILASNWTPAFKERLRSSRVESTLRIGEALEKAPKNRIWINASAIGYYGNQGPEVVNENYPPGNDFLAELALDWENALARGNHPGTRKIALRIGIVLDPREGALPRMVLPFRLFVGGRIGWDLYPMSWIHHEDLTGLILHGLTQTGVEGPLNATAPKPVSNAELAAAIARTLHRPNLFPAPRFALRLILGEAADAVSRGRSVLPAKALNTGYSFRFPDINSALADLLGA